MVNKERDKEVTPEVTPATESKPFKTTVTDAPDNPGADTAGAGTPSQRVLDEQAAGRAALREVGRSPVNPADADPAHVAGEDAQAAEEAQVKETREQGKTKK